MAIKLSVVFIMTITLLTSCGSPTRESIMIESIERQVLLFSNEENIKAEELYYDAILDLRTEFPEELKTVKIIHQTSIQINNDLIEVRRCPALLMVENNEIVAQIEGVLSKQQITEQLKHILNAK
jgi:hypothetical protein